MHTHSSQQKTRRTRKGAFLSVHQNTRGTALRNREAMGKGRSSGVEILTLVTNIISASLEGVRFLGVKFSSMKVVSLMMGVIFIFLTFSFITTTKTEAAPNYQMNYQGKLTNASNVAVADGTYNMRFWLLTSGTVATTSAIWTESLTGSNKVQVTNGLFSIMLGSTSPLTGVDFNQTLYLGVEIGGTTTPGWDGEMSPRKILGTVPAAFEADKLDGLTATQFVRTDATNTISTSSTDTLLTITQSGVGDILNLFDGTTEVFTVIDGGNLGLGTTSPSRKLTIQGGDAYIGGNLTATGTATFANLLVTGSSTIGGGTGSTGLTINGTATTTNLTVTSLTASRAIFTGADNLLTTTGVSQYLIDSLSDETGTGFAVFSASPTFTGTARFSSLIATASSTIGDGTATGGLTINGTATSTLGLIMSGTNSNITLGSNYLSGDGGDEGIFVDASGNVGIGTTTPYAKLTVSGEIIANYFTATGSTSTTTLAGGLNVNSGAITHDYASGLTTIQNMAFGSLNFDTDAGIVTWFDMPVTSASATGTVMSYSANIAGTSNLTVYAESAGNGGAQNFRVGIGSSTPTRTLTVSGDGWFTGNITSASSTLGYASSTSFTTGALRATGSSTIGDGTGTGGLTINGTATTTNLKITALSDGCLSTVSGLVTSSGSPCGSGGGSSNWLFDGTRLTPSTTIGIGVFASSTIGNGTGAGGLTINGTATSTLGLIMSGTNSNITLGSNYLSGDGGDEGIYVDASGNVGIGTTTPSSQLTIANFSASSTSRPFFDITASTTDGSNTSYQNSFFRISYASSTEIFGKVIDPEFVAEEQGTTPDTSLNSPYSVFVSGNYAYMANAGRDSLAVIDISNPADPVFVSEERGPTPGTSLDYAFSVFVSGNYAYVANFNRDSLAVIDISNPADPVFVSEERGPTPGTSLNGATSVFVSGNYAYMANSNRDSLAVINISNPADPVFISEELGPTAGTSLDGAWSLFVSGNYAYVTNLNRDSLAVIDISNPADPVFLSEERGPTPSTSLNGAVSVFVSGRYAYVANFDRDSLAVIDISNPADPVFISEELGPTAGTSLDAAQSVFVSGNYAYMANSTRDSLAVIDISNPADPVFISEERGPIPGTSLNAADFVFVSGNYAYVANASRNSLAVIDVGGATISNLAAGTAKIGNLQVDAFALFSGGAHIGGGLGIGAGGLFSQGAGSFTRMGTTTPLASTTLSWGNTPVAPALSALVIDGASSGVSDVFSLSHLATSTSASAGIGTGILFNSSVVSGATISATSTSRIASILTNVSSSTPQSVLTFSNKNTSGSLTEFMRLDHLGYLGLGTTSPSRKLTVQGGDGWFGGNLTATGTATFANLLVTGSTTIGDGTGAGGLTINGTATSTNLTVTALTPSRAIFTGADNLLTTTGVSQYLIDSLSDETGTGNLVFSTNPLLQGFRSNASSTIGDGTATGGLTINGTATSTLGLIMSGTNSNITLGSNYLSGDGGDEGIYVTALGSVVVGSTTANAAFTVEGITAIRSPNGNTDELFTVKTNTGVNILELNYKASSPTLRLSDEASATNDLFQLLDINNVVQGVFNDTGNLGLGTTSPSRKLTIQGGDAYIGGNLTATGTATFANLLVTGSSTIGGGTGSTGLTINGTATTTNLTVTSLTASRTIFTGADNLLTTTGLSQYLIDSLSDETGTGFAVFSASPTFTGTARFASLVATASSTIGGGTGATGLTISGGATTTGNAYFGGNISIGTTSQSARLTIDKTGVTGSTVAGTKEFFGFTNSTLSALYYGDETYIVNAPTATSTLVGKMIRIEDSTALGNVVRGFEAQAYRGTNTKGENTGLSGFGRTFGVRGTTIGDAGDTFLPAGVFAESQGTTQGNALRAYSGTITTEDLVSLFHDGSAFTGTGLQMNFGNTTGSFAATSTAKFLDLQVAGTSKFIISANGSTTLGDGTVNASLMIPRGGICVDNDGSCISTTTGEIRSVTSVLGNSDLAEIYFSNQALSAGEIVALSGGLSVVRASEASADNIIGVVSTKPGMTLGFDDTSLVSGESAYPIGLKGRVPIKLSTENGPIKKGDRITLSSIPGVGMKATESSRVVGMALEDYDGTRAYSVGFFNQFGDDMMKERISKKTVIDPRTQDGCYNGGGSALGETSCDPDAVKKTTITTVTDTTEYENMLTTLRNESSQMMMTEDGEEVAVGQALMFIELTNYQIATEASVLKELISTSTLTQENGTDTLWSRLKSLAQNFVDGVLTLTGIKADRVDVQNELCIDGVCVNADDLRALLQSAQGGGGGADSAPPSGGESGVPPDGNTSENIEGETTSGENQTMESGTPSITTEGSGEGVVPPSEPSTPPPEEPPVTEEVSLPPESTAEIPTSEPLVESSVNEQSPPPQESPP